MQKYSLEISDWGSWQFERDFSNIERAKQFAGERFPQNEWRIFDRVAGSFVYHHDPVVVMEREAQFETRRFQETERWRQIFAERAAADVVARQNRERLAEVASRQRQRQRDYDQQRRARLQGFNFVGSRPSVLDDYELMAEAINDFFTADRLDQVDKVNWLQEGF